MSIYLRAQLEDNILRGYWWIDGTPQNQYKMLARRVHDIPEVERKFDSLKQLQYSVLGKQLEQSEDSTKLKGIPDVKVWQNFLVREPYVADPEGIAAVRRSDSIAAQVKEPPPPSGPSAVLSEGIAPKGCLRLPYRSLWRGSFEMPSGEVMDGEEMCLTLTPSAPRLPAAQVPMSPLHASAERATSAVLKSQGEAASGGGGQAPMVGDAAVAEASSADASSSSSSSSSSGSAAQELAVSKGPAAGEPGAAPSPGPAAPSASDSGSTAAPTATATETPPTAAQPAGTHTNLPAEEATRVAAITRLKVLGEGANRLGRFTLTGTYDVATGLIASEKAYHAVPPASGGSTGAARARKRKRTDSRRKQLAAAAAAAATSKASSTGAAAGSRRRPPGGSSSSAAGASSSSKAGTGTGTSGDVKSGTGAAGRRASLLAVVDGTRGPNGEPPAKHRRKKSTAHLFGIAPPVPGTPAAAAAQQAALDAQQSQGASSSSSSSGRRRSGGKQAASGGGVPSWVSNKSGSGAASGAGVGGGASGGDGGSDGKLKGARSWLQEGLRVLAKGGVQIGGAVGSEWCEAHRLLDEAGPLSGDLYEGEIKGGYPHGVGTVVYRNGYMYEGMFQNGLESGYGVIADEHDQIVYEGTVADGMPNGKGKFTLPNGDVYTGGWKEGLFHGRGTYVVRMGGKYEGNWRDGVRDGAGDMQYPDGSEYSGLWRDGKRQGKGTFRHPNGFSYFGQWASDAMDGNGRAVYPDGSSYEGQFREGKRDGRGRYAFSNGMELNGRWKEDGLQGSGGTVSMQQTVKVNDDCSMIPINISTDLEKVHLRAGFTRSGS